MTAKEELEYHIPPEHIQKMRIANTPHWLREHFRQEAKKEERERLKFELLRVKIYNKTYEEFQLILAKLFLKQKHEGK